MITIELTYLTWTAVFTALMWMPYILNAIIVRGLINAVGYSENPKPLAFWAARMKQAHSNAIENLVVFGLLVFVVQAAGANNETRLLPVQFIFMPGSSIVWLIHLAFPGFERSPLLSGSCVKFLLLHKF